MRRPHAVDSDGHDPLRMELISERADDDVYRAFIYCVPDEDDDGTPSEGEVFLAKAKDLGVNVGGLVREMYNHWSATGGHSVPFDACTWPQALEYAEKALPWGHEAERYAWAIRYMWCLELPPAAITPDAENARRLMAEASRKGAHHD